MASDPAGNWAFDAALASVARLGGSVDPMAAAAYALGYAMGCEHQIADPDPALLSAALQRSAAGDVLFALRRTKFPPATPALPRRARRNRVTSRIVEALGDAVKPKLETSASPGRLSPSAIKRRIGRFVFFLLSRCQSSLV